MERKVTNVPAAQNQSGPERDEQATDRTQVRVAAREKAVSDAKMLPAGVFGLAKKIAKKFATKLKAESSEIQTESAFGEVVVHAIPVYDKPVNINSPRNEASDEEMEEVYKKLRKIEKPKVVKIRKETKKKAEVLKLRRRVP